jgi:tetratricopeptide (TPR) repeat protein
MAPFSRAPFFCLVIANQESTPELVHRFLHLLIEYKAALFMPPVTDTAPATHRCTRCGADFPVDSLGCPACGRVAGTQSARITLAVTLVLIIAGLAFTQYFVKLHRATQYSLANRWFLRGGQAMQANLPNVAADDYRTALSYDPENEEYRLRLAQALLAANRLPEARAHLLSLWEDEPSSGEVNLTLAQLFAKLKDQKSAIRYYNDAINGVWNDDPRKERIAARFELSNYLLQLQRTTEAQSELMALLAEEPRDVADQLRLGQLLLQVGETEHTISVDDAILDKDPKNSEAWLQKAQALLALNRYVEAEHALTRFVEQNPNLDQARKQLDVLREALRLDISLRGLSRADRAERAIESSRTAWKRLNACAAQLGVSLSPIPSTSAAQAAEPGTTATSVTPVAPPGPLQLLYNSGLQRQSIATEKSLREDPDELDSTIQYVFEVERTTAPICPNMDLTDQALLMLAQREAAK